MNTERIAAQQLASYGRFGDTMLLHVSPAEVQGIASLIPGGLTTNPVTGLPEAFFFLPFLSALFGGAGAAAAPAIAAGAAGAGSALAGGLAAGAGAAGAAGLASTLGAGALTPALTAGTGLLASAPALAATTAAPIATGTLGTLGAGAVTPTLASGGLGSLLGTAGATGAAGATNLAASLPAAAGAASAAPLSGAGGIGSLLGGAGTDAIIGPPSSSLAGSTVLGGAGTGLPPSSLGGSLATSPSSLGSGLPPADTLAGKTVLSGASTGLPPVGPPAPSLAGSTVLAGPKTGLPAVNAAVPPPADGSMFGKFGDYLTKNPMMAMAGLQALKGLIPAGGKKKKTTSRKGSWKGGGVTPAPEGFEHGGPRGEHLFYRSPNYYSDGGVIGYAEGGPVDPQAQMPQDMSFPLNGVPGGGISDLVPEDIPTSPFPTEQIGSEPEPPGGEGVSGDHDQELVMQMVEVIQGKHPDPEPVIKAFVQEFGEQALQDLVQRVKQTSGQKGPPPGPPPGRQLGPPPPNPMDQMGPMPPMGPQAGPPPGPQGFAYGGAVGGRGDGLSDSVPAMIDGRQPAALSRGEFVVPADAVSGLGNGSTDAGAEQLQGMVNNVRMARGGTVGQAPPIQGGIAAMMGGGLVGYKKGGKVQPPDDEEEIARYYMPLLEPDQRTRTEHIWDFANPPKVIPDSPYSQEWSDSIHELQKAKRYLLENNIQ